MKFNAVVHARMTRSILVSTLLAGPVLAVGPVLAANIDGQVLGGGSPIANSTVTLWAASAGVPRQLGQARSGADGRFSIGAASRSGNQGVVYLVAKGGLAPASKSRGDNDAIALMAVLGNRPPERVTISEMTTLASALTHAQFIDGSVIKGSPLALRIAAGNVPNFVDLATGGYGAAIQDGMNSSQTPTMANFATLANLLAGCTTKVTADA
jgi:hypothetical protein